MIKAIYNRLTMLEQLQRTHDEQTQIAVFVRCVGQPKPPDPPPTPRRGERAPIIWRGGTRCSQADGQRPCWWTVNNNGKSPDHCTYYR